jgi:hypothetical protein
MQAGASSAPLTYRVPGPANRVRPVHLLPRVLQKPTGSDGTTRRVPAVYCVQRGAVKPHAVPAAAGKIPQPFTDTAPCRKIPREPDDSSGSFSGISGRLIGYPIMAPGSATRTGIMADSPLRFIRRAAETDDAQCQGNAKVREHCD